MPRFLYLFQVEQELPEHLRDVEGPDSEVRFLSYRARSSDPRQLFYPSSSWTQGRNRLLREYCEGDWTYFIFGDADVRLEHLGRGARQSARKRNPWREFERFLLEYEPAVGTPAYSWHLSGRWDTKQEVQTLRFFDPVLNAFHREALVALLPYYDLLDEACADYSGSIVGSIAADLYPGHVLQTNRVRVVNPLSLRHYTERLLTKAETLYLESLRVPQEAESFRRQPEWGQLQHPSTGPALRKSELYLRSEAQLAERYRLDHGIWARKRELLSMPSDHAFYSDDANSDRARRWRAHGLGSSPATQSGLRRFAVRTQALRASLGLVRTSPLLAPFRWYQRLRAALHHRWSRWQIQRRHPNVPQLWAGWRRDAHQPIALAPDGPDIEQLLAAALDQLAERTLVFVNVGTSDGDALGHLRASVALRKFIVSIGVDRTQTEGFSWYSAQVLGAVDDGMLALRLILQQYNLARGPLHWVRIVEGDALAAARTLGDRLQDCLFLTLRLDRSGHDAPAQGARSAKGDEVPFAGEGFQPLAASAPLPDGRLDVTLVNVNLARSHFPHLLA